MSAAGPRAYAVRLRSRRVQRELDALQASDYRRVLARLEALAGTPWPAGCEKLEGDIYRVRAGDIRVIYRVDDGGTRVDVGAIRRRSETTYRGVGEVFR